MSALENAAKPTLTPMIESTETSLDATATLNVRAWGVKTALGFAYAAEQELTYPIPIRLGTELYAAREARGIPAGAEVWVAQYGGTAFAYRHMLSLSAGRHPILRTTHHVLRVVFVAGHVAFYVRLPDSVDAAGMVRRPSPPEFRPLFQIPPGRQLRWVHGSLTDQGISDTFNRHINAGIEQTNISESGWPPIREPDPPMATRWDLRLRHLVVRAL